MSVELIASAITAAIVSGATSAASDTAKKAVGDAYSGLKALLVRKFGGDSPTVNAMNSLEAKPDSQSRQGVLTEELAAAKVEAHPEIVSSAQSLLELLKALPQGGSFSQTSYGAGSALSGHGGTSTVTNNFGTNRPRGGSE
ncbi:MAG: hypothetical protein WBQ94_27120 [Terracidiphilus sp.]